MSKSWQLSITIIIYFIISCHSRIQDIFMKQHHSITHYCKCELFIGKDNNIHGKYCTQTIPVSFNSSFEKKKHHERQLIQKINEYCKLTTTGLYMRASSRRPSPASLPNFAGYLHCFTSQDMLKRWNHNRLLFTKLQVLKNLKKTLNKLYYEIKNCTSTKYIFFNILCTSGSKTNCFKVQIELQHIQTCQ